MSKHQRLLQRILRGQADAAIPFEDFCNLLSALGFETRTRGRHHIFRRPDVEDRINLQREGRYAKAYQVRQVRAVILRHQLGGEL